MFQQEGDYFFLDKNIHGVFAAMNNLLLYLSSTNFADVILAHLFEEIVELDSAVVGVELSVLPQLCDLDKLHKGDKRVLGEMFEPAHTNTACTITNPANDFKIQTLKEDHFADDTCLRNCYGNCW